MRPLVDDLLGRMLGVFRNIWNPRSGSNRQYALDDILMAAFSVFFMESPSFLEHRRMAASAYGRHACSALFGVDPLPTDNHIRRQLDRIDSSDLHAGFDITLETLREHRAMQSYQVLGGRTLIALDGSEFHHSRKLHCPRCQKRVCNRDQENPYASNSNFGDCFLMASYRLLFSNDVLSFRFGWETVRDALPGKKTKQVRSFGTAVLDFPVTVFLTDNVKNCSALKPIRKIFR